MQQGAELWHIIVGFGITALLWVLARGWEYMRGQDDSIKGEVKARFESDLDVQQKLAEQENELRDEFRRLIRAETKTLSDETAKIEKLLRGLDFDVREHVMSQQGQLVEFKAGIEKGLVEHEADVRERIAEIKEDFARRMREAERNAVTKENLKDLKDDFKTMSRQQNETNRAVHSVAAALAKTLDIEINLDAQDG